MLICATYCLPERGLVERPRPVRARTVLAPTSHCLRQYESPPQLRCQNRCRRQSACASICLLVRPARFERATPGFVGQCSDPLSYGRAIGAGDRNRTRIVGLEDRCLSHSATPALVFSLSFTQKSSGFADDFLHDGPTKVGLYFCRKYLWSGQPATIRHLRRWRRHPLPIKLCPLKTGRTVLAHQPACLKTYSQVVKELPARDPLTPAFADANVHPSIWYAAPDSNRDCRFRLLLLRQAGLPIPLAAHKSQTCCKYLVRRDGIEPPMFQRTSGLQPGALPLGQRRITHTNKKPGAVRHPGFESCCWEIVSMHAHRPTHSHCPAPGAARALHAKQRMRQLRAKLRQRAPGAHVGRDAPADWARPWITAAVTSVFHLFPAVAGFLLLSYHHETDFNSCTLACREAPCGCVTAPPCSPRGGMGLGTSACSPSPLLACIHRNLLYFPLETRLQKQKGPGTLWVAGPFGLNRGA